jgi:hypothetical protein
MPLIEIMQIKGNSEVHRSFWAADEFSNFENTDSIAEYSDRTFDKYGKTARLETSTKTTFRWTVRVHLMAPSIVGGPARSAAGSRART